MRWIWIDRILVHEPGKRLVAVKNVSLAEEHLHDHFGANGNSPPRPVMPGSLVVEGMAQTAGILVGAAGGFKEKVVLAKVVSVELRKDAVPGQTLRYEALMERFDSNGASTTGAIDLRDAASDAWERIGEIELLFSHLDRNMAGMEFPEENFVFGENFRTILAAAGLHTSVRS